MKVKTEFLTFTLKVKIQYDISDNKSRLAAIKEAKKLRGGCVYSSSGYYVEEGSRKLIKSANSN